MRKRLTQRIAEKKRLAQDEEIVEDLDPRFVEKVRSLKRSLPKLTAKKNRKLRQYGVEMIRGNDTVEDLIDALMRITQS